MTEWTQRIYTGMVHIVIPLQSKSSQYNMLSIEHYSVAFFFKAFVLLLADIYN